MLGNMYEWCQEQYSSASHETKNEIEHINETQRLLRGGSFNDLPAFVRSAFRCGIAPSSLEPNFGFRIARTYY